MCCSAEGVGLKDEVMKIAPVQKQTKAGQRTRFRVRSILCYFASDLHTTTVHAASPTLLP